MNLCALAHLIWIILFIFYILDKRAQDEVRRESESQERAQKHLEKVQKDQLRERRLANKEEWDNLTPIAYMNKCKIDLEDTESRVRDTLYSLNPKNFARNYYGQFPPYYLLEVLIKKGHKLADTEYDSTLTQLTWSEWASDFNEALESLDYQHNTRRNIIQDALKEVEWKMHTVVLPSNDSPKTRKDVDNLLKFLRSDDPAMRRMGLSMAEKTNFEIGIEDLELELIEIIAEKLRDKNRRVRTAAALQLGANGDGRARYELEQALLTVDRDVLKNNPFLKKASYADKRYESVLRRTELINDYLEKLDEEEWDE